MTQDSCSAGDPLDVTRSIIDRNIACLEERIRALKSRRNELSPISRLPFEILCNVFSLIQDNVPYSCQSPKSWTSFSRVSQHWRSSALSAPELWANIPLSHSRWAQEMLIRSKMAKLTIRSRLSFGSSSPKSIATFRSCLYEMNRVEEIAIRVLGLILKDIFRDLPNKTAPQLHTLCIQNYSPSKYSIHEDFLLDTERLQRVELINCEISWDSRLLTGLTRLTLEDSLKANSSIIQFLHALQRMPALTDLHLIDAIPDDSEGQSTYPVVDLPCLRVLEISSGVGALTAALHHISFPHSAILSLTCKENQSAQIDFSNFFSVLVTKFLSSLVIRTLFLEQPDTIEPGLEFYLWTTAIIQDWFSPVASVQPQLQLVLTWPSPELNDHVKVLTSAFDAMNLPFSHNYIYRPRITSIPRHGSRLLESFLYWNGCARRAIQHTPSLRHWFIKRRQSRNRTQPTAASPFLNFAISISKALLSSRLHRPTSYWITLWRDVKETQRFGYFV